MIDPDPNLGPRIKLADFGFATEIKPLGKNNLKVSLGTRLNMSPELVKGEEHSMAVDIWAVGVFAFYLQSYGQYPFPGITKEVVNNKILNEAPNMGTLQDSVFPHAKSFIERCLTKDANERPKVTELLEDIYIKAVDLKLKRLDSLELMENVTTKVDQMGRF